MRLFYTVLLLVPGLLAGCHSIEGGPEGEVVAQIEESRLNRKELERIIPVSSTGEDSANFARRYINSWALDRLLVMEAQKRLSKEEMDIEGLVEEYKNQLLIFRLENKYIGRYLDTMVTISQMEEYYNRHLNEFKTKDGLIKGWTATMYTSSPLLSKIRSLLMQSGKEGGENPEEFLYNAALKYQNFTETWTDLSTVAKDMGIDTSTLTENIKKGNLFFESTSAPFCRYLYVTDYIGKEKLSPFEYNTEKIKSRILSNRKMKLLSDYHRELLNKALDDRKLKITDNEDD